MPGSGIKICVIAGSQSDLEYAQRAIQILDQHGVRTELRVISAHRQHDELDEFLEKSDAQIYIAIAGLSAALAGFIASKTDKPVIGVPLSSKLMGLDALLSMVQMPRGVPVAVVGIDNPENAAYFALRILELIRKSDSS